MNSSELPAQRVFGETGQRVGVADHAPVLEEHIVPDVVGHEARERQREVEPWEIGCDFSTGPRGKAWRGSDPYSEVEVPPKVFIVPGMLTPPSCQAQAFFPLVE